jgi:hypothetical protein
MIIIRIATGASVGTALGVGMGILIGAALANR